LRLLPPMKKASPARMSTVKIISHRTVFELAGSKKK
jgi:hypothetical protein